MKEHRTRQKYNTGSALITVLAVITVILVVVLSVLAMSYRYYMMESGSIFRQKGDEAARSLSEELGGELTGPGFTKVADAEAAKGLWKYVRTNIGTADWKYVDSGRFSREAYTGSSDPYTGAVIAAATGEDEIKAAKREFALDAGGALSDEVPETKVVLYWEPGRYSDRLNESRLYVEVTTTMGDHRTVITKRYKLSISSFSDVSPGAVDPTDRKYQNWSWTYDGEI